MYMPLTDSGNTNMSADNSRTYALLLKSEKDDNSSEYVNQLQALRPSFQRHDEIYSASVKLFSFYSLSDREIFLSVIFF